MQLLFIHKWADLPFKGRLCLPIIFHTNSLYFFHTFPSHCICNPTISAPPFLLFSKMKAIVVSRYGTPSVLTPPSSVEAPNAQTLPPNHILVKNAFAGVNFIDIYMRKGPSPLAPRKLPFVLGCEGAGSVCQVGAHITDVKVGDQVAYLSDASYAEVAEVPEGKYAKVPAGVSLESGCAILLQGMTAAYLTTDTYAVKRGDWVLVHAAAGGTGSLVCRLALHLGARVIGTTTSPGKAQAIRELGVEHVLVSSPASPTAIQDGVREITGGRGVDVVYDAVGLATFEASLASLGKRGHFVSYGDASGHLAPVDLNLLAPKCLAAHRVALFFYADTKESFAELATRTFKLLQSGVFKVKTTVYPLDQAQKAHEDLEGKQSTGKLLLRVA